MMIARYFCYYLLVSGNCAFEFLWWPVDWHLINETANYENKTVTYREQPSQILYPRRFPSMYTPFVSSCVQYLLDGLIIYNHGVSQRYYVFHLQRASNTILLPFLCRLPKQADEGTTVELSVIWEAMTLRWRHCQYTILSVLLFQ